MRPRPLWALTIVIHGPSEHFNIAGLCRPPHPMCRENNISTKYDCFVSEWDVYSEHSGGLCPQWCEDKKFGGLEVDFGRWWVFSQSGEGIRDQEMGGLRAETDAEKRSRKIGANLLRWKFVDSHTVRRAYWFNISSNNFNNPGKCNIWL